MSQLVQALIAVGAVLGVLAVIGASLAVVRGSYSKARTQALREDNDDLRLRLGDCEEKIDGHIARERILETKVEHLTSENTLLTSMVTQRADVQEVMTKLNEHHEAAMANQAKLIAAVIDLGEHLHDAPSG